MGIIILNPYWVIISHLKLYTCGFVLVNNHLMNALSHTSNYKYGFYVDIYIYKQFKPLNVL